MGVITLTGGRGYQDIGTVGQTVQQLAGNVQSINQILDVGLRNSRDYQNGWIRVSDMIGLGICKLINTDQLQYIPAEGTSLTASDSLVVTAGNLTLVNDSADPGDNKFYGTNASGTLGWYSVSEGATGANPTGAVTFSQVNGSATTFMRSDAAPELSSSIYSSLNVASTLCYRDANGNVHANNFESAIHGNAATGTITLTNASARIQTFSSGSGSAIVVLPDATTLHIGHTIELDDNASGNLTVQLSGTGTTFLTMLPGSYLVLQCTSISFPAGQWNYYWTNPATNQGLVQDSIVLSSGVAQLSGDSASPGNSFFYGTNGSGTKGWYAQTYPAALTFSDSVSLSGTTVTLSGDSASPGDNFFYGTNSSGTRGWYASTPASIGLSFVESAGWNSSNGAIQLALTVAQDILIPYACTLTQVVVLTQGTPGSCTVAIQHCTSGLISNYPPSVDVTNGNSPVTAAGTQVISAATMASQTWVTSFLANDVIRLTLTANAAFTSVKIILRFQ